MEPSRADQRHDVRRSLFRNLRIRRSLKKLIGDRPQKRNCGGSSLEELSRYRVPPMSTIRKNSSPQWERVSPLCAIGGHSQTSGGAPHESPARDIFVAGERATASGPGSRDRRRFRPEPRPPQAPHASYTGRSFRSWDIGWRWRRHPRRPPA
jgi:hypothetical protein